MRVEPIKNTKNIRKIIEKLTNENRYRDLILFEIGIYTGLRIGDILRLKVSNIKNGKIQIKQSKTGKYKTILMHPELKRGIEKYIKGKEQCEYLIKSRQGNKAISYTQAYRIIIEISKKAKLKGNFGTHSLRKTYGYHLYNDNDNDISIVQGALNHENQRDTLIYIGADEEAINKATKGLNYS